LRISLCIGLQFQQCPGFIYGIHKNKYTFRTIISICVYIATLLSLAVFPSAAADGLDALDVTGRKNVLKGIAAYHAYCNSIGIASSIAKIFNGIITRGVEKDAAGNCAKSPSTRIYGLI